MGNELSILEDSQQALSNATCLHTAAEANQAISKMATAINQTLSESYPLLLPVMIGGVMLAGKLIPQLTFPLQPDYVHAIRYRSGTNSHELDRIKKPGKQIRDKTVLLIDDILDEGITLAAIIDYC